MLPRVIVGGGRGRFALPELGGKGGEEKEGAERQAADVRFITSPLQHAVRQAFLPR